MPTPRRLPLSLQRTHLSFQSTQHQHQLLTPSTRTGTGSISLLNLQHQQQTRPQSSIYKKLFRKWTGMFGKEHAVNRAQDNDTTDPETKASSEGMAERTESEGIADPTKSEATTERGGLKAERKAKGEHPKAPEPVIGMNDERGNKGP